MTEKNSCERCGDWVTHTQEIAEDTYHYKVVCEHCYKQHTNPRPYRKSGKGRTPFHLAQLINR